MHESLTHLNSASLVTGERKISATVKHHTPRTVLVRAPAVAGVGKGWGVAL